MDKLTKYALWAACKQIRDAADNLFAGAGFTDSHPEEPATRDDIELINTRLNIVQARITDLRQLFPPF